MGIELKTFKIYMVWLQRDLTVMNELVNGHPKLAQTCGNSCPPNFFYLVHTIPFGPKIVLNEWRQSGRKENMIPGTVNGGERVALDIHPRTPNPNTYSQPTAEEPEEDVFLEENKEGVMEVEVLGACLQVEEAQ
ncbi:hypothetical protein HS088_TW14G00454 [Tripterygium wilfordii]|uniref:Uncharacterized protein n=1 Tax=Tripterygium wilfordii TaxID=458696 RepID=A0A7J7CQI2_TRIWF|nr:hypothetical protein HS088_TW14G00454 [Tripterygium wilfordii]